MKNYINKALLILLSGIILAGCDHDFADINTDPKTVYDINPINHFYVAALTMNNSSFEFYYDICGKQMPWMQYIVGTSGNGSTTYDYISNQGDRYSRFVSSGGYVKDIEEYIKANYTEAEQEKYRDLIQIARVLLIYYGIYASDTFGSLVYDEGWQARYGGITEPSFQSQEDLYNEWDNQLKNAINLLKQSGPAQVSIGGYDPVYGGKVQNWIKAANALRLRLATRWVKRDISKAKSIASEVLNADPGNLFTSNDDGWIFKFETNVAGHENYNRIASYKAT